MSTPFSTILPRVSSHLQACLELAAGQDDQSLHQAFRFLRAALGDAEPDVTVIRSALDMVRHYLSQRRAMNVGIIAARPVTADEMEAACARLRTACDEFRTAMEGNLARFEAAWPREVEYGLAELDGRQEQILSELKVALAPKGVIPKRSLVPNIVAVIRPHVVATAACIESRVTPLRRELEEAIAGSIRYAQQGPKAGAEAALSAMGASAASVAAGSLHKLAWTVSLVSTSVNIMEMDFAETIFEWVSRKLPIGGKLVHRVGTGILSLMSKVKLVRKATKVFNMGFWVLFVLQHSAPRFRDWLLNSHLPEGVNKAMAEVRSDLSRQYEERARALVARSREIMKQMRQDVEQDMEQKRQLLLTPGQEGKARAIAENERIDALLAGHEEIERSLRELTGGPEARA